jgi:eukaryotic-like serine/threonine-protein kinase
VLADGPLEGFPESASDKAALPRAFGSYELLEEIARGGMGIVYRARQTQINRLVAVKVVASGVFAAPDFVERFRTEAEAVASLNHPNIVPIYEVGDCEGHPFFSMRFIEGGSLAQRIAESASPISNRDAAKLLSKLARAVHFAHQRGILHRDIKPGNVLLDAKGEPHLTDFGLAKLVEKDSALTRTMAMLGTPSYMSPEQARGEAKQFTTAVDVYGLGAVLYELLTGQPPFAGGTTMRTVRLVLEKEPRPPWMIQPGVDRDLETICLKCLEKDPGRRYSSAEALAEDLERWLKNEPIQARPVTGIERLSKWMRRRPLAAILCSITMVAVAASVATLIWANLDSRAAQAKEKILRQQAQLNEQRATEARNDAKSEAEQRRQQLVRLHVAAGNKLVDEGDAFMGLLQFVEALRLESGDSTRDEIHRRRFAAALRTAPRLKQFWTGAGFGPARISPDGTRMVCGDGRGGAQVFDAESGEPLGLPLKTQTATRLAWFTPDGKFVATLDQKGHLHHWPADASGSINHPLPEVPLANGWRQSDCVDYTADGRWVAAVLPSGVQVYEVATGEPVGPLLAEAVAVRRVRFSPDGQTVAIAAKRPSVQILEVLSGRQLLELEQLKGDRPFVEFTPDGMRLVTASGGTHDVDVRDIRRGERLFPTINAGFAIAELELGRVGNSIAAAGAVNVRLFDGRTSHPVLEMISHGSHITRMQFSPDGRQLATSSFDETARIWDVTSGRQQFPALRHAHVVTDVQYSLDGRRLLTTSTDATVRLWELPSGHGERLSVNFKVYGRFYVCFSPDGRRILVYGERGLVRVWEADSGSLVFARNFPLSFVSASFNGDGTHLVVVDVDGFVRLWNLLTNEEVFSVQHTAAVRHVEFSPKGNQFLTASDDGTARLWNAVDGSPSAPPLVHTGAVQTAAFSPDGRHIVTGSADGSACVWDALTGACVSRLKTKYTTNLYGVSLSSDGRRLLTLTGGRTPVAQLWDPTTGRRIGREASILSGARYPAAFSPDGKRYLLLHDTTSVAIMDSETGQTAAPLLRHENLPVWFAFSPDGRMVLTCEDAAARVWDAESGESVTPPLRGASYITRGNWSPNGREVVTTTYDGSVQVWDVSPDFSTVAEFERHAELLTAHRLDPKAGFVPLTPAGMNARWRLPRK